MLRLSIPGFALQRCVALPIYVALQMGASTAAAAEAEACAASSSDKVVPLVELYTAEGCSDCPPADAWLSKFALDTPSTQASVLAFHVDYWDAVGWTDPFADAAYSQRQNYRVRVANKKVVYTPNVMIGKDTTVNWREQGTARRALAKEGAKPASVELALKVNRSEAGLAVNVGALPLLEPLLERAAGKAPNVMWLALYQDDLVSDIREGENKGKTLHHDRVTRVLKGPWAIQDQRVAGDVSIPLKSDANLAKYGLVLFAESTSTGAGLQSLTLPLSSCRL